jgi:hypothetical protein
MLSRYKLLNAEWLITGSGNMVKKSDQNPVNLDSGGKVKQLELFQSLPEIPPLQEPSKNSRVIPEPAIPKEHTIDKILIFYSDKTFEEFSSAKNS